MTVANVSSIAMVMTVGIGITIAIDDTLATVTISSFDPPPTFDNVSATYWSIYSYCNSKTSLVMRIIKHMSDNKNPFPKTDFSIVVYAELILIAVPHHPVEKEVRSGSQGGKQSDRMGKK